MNTLHNVGKQVSSFELYDQLDPITGIWLFVGEDRDEDLYKAGNETGTVLEVYCPYGNPTMANTLLSQLQGQVYAGFRAQNAVLSPTAELGDWVTVNGGTYMLAYRSVTFGPGHMAEIAAPGESTQEHEYGWTSPETRKYNYNQTRSMISKTNKEIQLAIYGEDGKGGLSGQMTTFTASLSGIESRVKKTEADYSVISQNVSNIAMEVHGSDGKGGLAGQYSALNIELGKLTTTVTGEGGLSGKYTALEQTVSNLSLKVIGLDGKETSVSLSDGSISLYGLVTISSLGADGTTEIHGGRITTGTINAKRLNLYGDLEVYKKSNRETLGGHIGYIEGFDNSIEGDDEDNTNIGIGVMDGTETGQCICTDMFARLSFGNWSQVIARDDYLDLRGADGIRFQLPEADFFDPDEGPQTFLNYAQLNDVCFRPYSARTIMLGNASNAWDVLYAGSCSCCDSDRNKKNSIEALPDKYLTLFDGLTPVRFKLNKGKSGRYHIGYIAQEVKAAMDEAGIDSTEFGGWVMDTDEDGNEIYMLRYEEFGAIYAAKIKQLEARVAELEERL